MDACYGYRAVRVGESKVPAPFEYDEDELGIDVTNVATVESGEPEVDMLIYTHITETDTTHIEFYVHSVRYTGQQLLDGGEEMFVLAAFPIGARSRAKKIRIIGDASISKPSYVTVKSAYLPQEDRSKEPPIISVVTG